MIIRCFISENVADLHEIFGNDETMKSCEPAYDLEKTKNFLRSFCIERNGAVAAVHKESGKLIGYILFNEYEKDVYEIGRLFNRSFWRQGYAFEACSAVISYAFDELGAHKVFAETIDTVKSVALMRKLGMQAERIEHGQTADNSGNEADLHVYCLINQNLK